MWRHPRYEELTGRSAPTAAPAPPEPSGEVLAAFPRKNATGPKQELRVSLDTFEGHPYVSIRVWQEGEGGAWWPVKGKGVSVRMGEAQGVAEALSRALEVESAGRVGRALEKVRRIDAIRRRASADPEPTGVASSTGPPWEPAPETAGADWL